jgi:hypothetical protein
MLSLDLTKFRLSSSVLIFGAIMGVSSSAFAKKQFYVPGEIDAYRQSCKNNVKTLGQALQEEPEAREFLRLVGETNGTNFGLKGYIFCQTVFVPKNIYLKNVVVTQENKKSLDRLLRAHVLGASFIEESDFTSDTTRLRSWSGLPLDLSRSADGVKTVNGVKMSDETSLESSSHTIALMEGILPEAQQSISDAISNWDPYQPRYRNEGGPEFYPVLSNVTGKPGLSFNEIMTLCKLDTKLAKGGVTVLLPTSIPYLDAPIFDELWKSDVEFVCRAFSSNILDKRHTPEDLVKLGQTNSGTVSTIDSRAVPVIFQPKRPERFSFTKIGYSELSIRNTISGGTGESVNGLISSSYAILEVEGFASVN